MYSISNSRVFSTLRRRPPSPEVTTMQLQSNDFSHYGRIPPTFTCDGESISPQLRWVDFPTRTASFALSCIDPDAPSGHFRHWLIINIPHNVTEIPQHQTVGQEISNDANQSAYVGSCPPSGQHRYIFTVYALDTPTLENITADNFAETVKTHTIDSAELIGLYERMNVI